MISLAVLYFITNNLGKKCLPFPSPLQLELKYSYSLVSTMLWERDEIYIWKEGKKKIHIYIYDYVQHSDNPKNYYKLIIQLKNWLN